MTPSNEKCQNTRRDPMVPADDSHGGVMRGILVLAVLLIAVQAAAFAMNPLAVDCWGHDFLCNFTKVSEKLKFPVHETRC